MQREKKYEYAISVVMPLYNMEKYLPDAMYWLLRQTIGIEHMQIIMINDGSPDGVDAICRKYAAMYPKQIIYKEKKNGGVSSARNMGIPLIKGKYATFLDADDHWSITAFETVIAFLEKHKTVDVASCRILHEGDAEGRPHPLDFRFRDGARIVNLWDEPNMIQSTIGNVIFRSEAIQNHRFNERLTVGEDSFFTNSLLLERMKVAIIDNAFYYYRKNADFKALHKSYLKQKENYTVLPKELYGDAFFGESLRRYGEVIPYVQSVVFYDMKWRGNRPWAIQILTEEEMDDYVETLHDLLQWIDDQVIRGAKGITQYRKYLFLQLKYQKNLLRCAEVKKCKLYYDGTQILDLRGKDVCRIKTIQVNSNWIRISGITKAIFREDVIMYVKDNEDNYFHVSLTRYPKSDETDIRGETLIPAFLFEFEVPTDPRRKYGIYVGVEENTVLLRPSFYSSLELKRGMEHSYFVQHGVIIKWDDKKLKFGVYKDCKRTRIASEFRYGKELIEKKGAAETVRIRSHALTRRKYWDKPELKKQVAFLSVRSNDKMEPNLQAVYDEVNAKKIHFIKMRPYDEKSQVKAWKYFSGSKVIVTDDYYYLLRAYGKKEGQKVAQIWHACGAFKKFGADGTSLTPQEEFLFHADYDYVTVSSEAVRGIYANAFQIDESKVHADGCPRTDRLLDPVYREKKEKKVLRSYPDLKGKTVIVYAPTFRDLPGLKKSKFVPELDFQKVSEALGGDTVMCICPHPVMTEPILARKYPNIYEVRDFGTMDVLLLADLLITDYSSVIFEYSLLHKPMVFYCYDYDTYNRDFYIDYERDLPGKIFYKQDELLSYLEKSNFDVDKSQDRFTEKYMSACDGHSAERVAHAVEALLQD